jgi:hypothetical protein
MEIRMLRLEGAAVRTGADEALLLPFLGMDSYLLVRHHRADRANDRQNQPENDECAFFPPSCLQRS